MSHETLFDQVKMKFIIEHMEPELNEWAQVNYIINYYSLEDRVQSYGGARWCRKHYSYAFKAK